MRLRLPVPAIAGNRSPGAEARKGNEMNLRSIKAFHAAPVVVCALGLTAWLAVAPTAHARGPAPVTHDMIAAANPLAVDAGLQMLRAGGSAVDAAIAVQLVLTLVEPESSGIGGGAFMLLY